MAELPASTLRLLERIGAVDYASTPIDRPAVERALRAHLLALDLPDRPVRWLDDAAGGWSYVIEKAERAARRAQPSAGDAAGDAAWAAARDAARDAARAAAWDAAREKVAGIWLPFVDAFEAGLFLYWITPDEIVAVPRPVMLLQGDRLHCEDGPAVHWPSGERYWFWRGVRVPQRVIEQASRLTPEEVLGEPNVEVRRVMMERFGFDRLVRETNAELVSQDDYGKLWRVPIPGDEDLVMVEVVNSTAEPDGSFKDYFLRVPPSVRTAHEAVAWTWDMPLAIYAPAVET